MNTKNEIYARLSILENLSSELDKFKEKLIKDLSLEGITLGMQENETKFVHTLIGQILDNEITKDEAYSKLSKAGYLKNMSKGEEINPIDFKLTEYLDFEVKLKLDEENALVSYLSCNPETLQMGTIYEHNKGVVDLSLSEIKIGDYAEMYNKSRDNKDVDIYVWGDAFSEDHTNKTTISYEDIKEALNDKEEDLEM